LEDTKRKKLAIKAQKLVELMMVSGVPTASGYEERIRFEEIEVVDRSANDSGLTANVPTGQEINGWDVNVAGVRMSTARRHVRQHSHAVWSPQKVRSTSTNADPGIPVTSQAGREARDLRRASLRRIPKDA